MSDKNKIHEIVSILLEHEHIKNKRTEPIKISTIKKYLANSSADIPLDKETIIKICEKYLGNDYIVRHEEKPKLVYIGASGNTNMIQTGKSKKRTKYKRLSPVDVKNETKLSKHTNFIEKIDRIILLKKPNDACPYCRKLLLCKEVDVATYIGKPFVTENRNNFKRIKSFFCDECNNYYINKRDYGTLFPNTTVYAVESRVGKPKVVKVLNYYEKYQKNLTEKNQHRDPNSPSPYNKHLFPDYESSPDGRI